MTADIPPAADTNNAIGIPPTAALSTAAPAGWQEVRLGDVADIQKGTSFTSSQLIPGNVPVIAGGKHPAYYHSVANRPKDTITVSASGAHAGFVAFHRDPIFATDCTTIRSKPAITATPLIYHALQLKKRVILRRRSGSAQPHIYPRDIATLPFSLPPLPEQKAIAAILDSIDEVIGRTEELITATQQLGDALRHQLLTRGLPGRHTSWQYAPGLKATIPAEWKVVRLGDVATVRKEKIIPTADTSHTYIGLEHITRGRLKDCGKACDTFSHKTVFHAGDTLYGKLRPNLRKTVRVHFDGVCSTDILALYAKSIVESIAEFINHLIQSNQLHRHAMRGITGSRMPRTSWNHLRKFQFACPPLAEQKAIAAILDSVDTAVEHHQAECEALKDLKASASDALLTGRVRVPVAREGVVREGVVREGVAREGVAREGGDG